MQFIFSMDVFVTLDSFSLKIRVRFYRGESMELHNGKYNKIMTENMYVCVCVCVE